MINIVIKLINKLAHGFLASNVMPIQMCIVWGFTKAQLKLTDGICLFAPVIIQNHKYFIHFGNGNNTVHIFGNHTRPY